MVASPSQDLLEKRSSPTKNQGSSIGPQKPSNSSPTVLEVNTERLFHIRQYYENHGLSQKTTEPILSAHPVSTHKTYQSAWKKWDSWCRAREVDHIFFTIQRFNISPHSINFFVHLRSFRNRTSDVSAHTQAKVPDAGETKHLNRTVKGCRMKIFLQFVGPTIMLLFFL